MSRGLPVTQAGQEYVPGPPRPVGPSADSGTELKYIIFLLSPTNTEIVVASSSASASYDDFLAELPAESCCYAIYDFEYEKPGEGRRNKLCFYAWCVFSARQDSADGL